MLEKFINVINDCSLDDENKIHQLEEILLINPNTINLSDEHGYYPIHHACKTSNVRLVQWLLNKGASCEQVVDFNKKPTHQRGKTPMHIAAGYGCVEITKILAKAGASLAKLNKYGASALTFAAFYGHEVVVRWLLQQPVVWAHQKLICAAGYEAVRGRKLNTLKLLMDQVIDIFSLSNSHYVLNFPEEEFYKHAIQIAVMNGYEEIVEFLLNKDKKLSHLVINGNTLMHFAANQENTNILNFLYQHDVPINDSNDKGLYPIHIAVRNSPNAAKWLLAHGVSVDQKTKNLCANTPLHEAAMFSICYHMQYLLDWGAKINESNGLGLSALHIAALRMRFRFSEIANELRDRTMGAKNEIVAKCEVDSAYYIDILNTSFHFMKKILIDLLEEFFSDLSLDHLPKTENKNEKTEDWNRSVQWLLENGANINQSMDNEEGDTIFHIAAKFGYLDLLKLLSAHQNYQVLLNSPNKKGYYLIHHAVKYRHLEFVKYLLEGNKNKISINQYTLDDIYSPLSLAIKGGDIGIIKFLYQQGAAKTGKWPIHCLAENCNSQEYDQNNNLEILNFLLEESADINSVTYEGETLLHLVVQKLIYDHINDDLNPYFSLIEALLQRKINVSLKNNENETALDLFLYNKSSNIFTTEKVFHIFISFVQLLNSYKSLSDLLLKTKAAEWIRCSYLGDLLDFFQQNFTKIYARKKFQRMLIDFSLQQKNMHAFFLLAHYGFLINYVFSSSQQAAFQKIPILWMKPFFTLGTKNFIFLEQSISTLEDIKKIPRDKEIHFYMRILNIELKYNINQFSETDIILIKNMIEELAFRAHTLVELTIQTILRPDVEFTGDNKLYGAYIDGMFPNENQKDLKSQIFKKIGFFKEEASKKTAADENKLDKSDFSPANTL